MADQTFFYLPDISGFTAFVKEVEVDHSQHIISELLELVIDSNELGLSVAEVEGDAVFFYKNGSTPSSKEILDQTRKTYIQFHEHLKLYETRRICNCGACSSAVGLSLKFVAHQGESSLIDVKGNKKPFGEEVIKAHRLLKNKVEGREYLLYTGNLVENPTLNDPEIPWTDTVEGADDYEELGTVNYNSVGLAPLRTMVMSPPPIAKLERGQAAFEESIVIDKNKEEVFEIISNLNFRKLWNPTVDEFKFNKDEINQIGTKHTCVIGSRTVEFETVTSDFGSDRLVYGEKTTEIPLIREGVTYFVVEDHDGKTEVCVECHFRSSPIKMWIFKKLLANKLRGSLVNSLGLIKSVAEKGELTASN
jgi:hypothetical protein